MTMQSPATFTRTVEAMRYQPGPGGNCEAVCEWLGVEHDHGRRQLSALRVGRQWAHPGDWIVKTEDGPVLLTHDRFTEIYQPTEEEA